MHIQAYLEHGDVDEEGFINENVEWVEYWRNLYPKVTIENIEKYKKKYQNSEEEKTELLDAYKKHKVDFQFYGRTSSGQSVVSWSLFKKILRY